MPTWIPFAWYALGLVGCALVWFERTQWKWASEQYEFWCPTPKVIFFSFWASFAGPAMLLIGLIIVASSSDIGRNSWWNKPVCKRAAND